MNSFLCKVIILNNLGQLCMIFMWIFTAISCHKCCIMLTVCFLFFLDYLSLEPRITVSVKEVGDILLSIKGGGQISSMNQPPPRATVSAEADEVLRPLMDLLDGNF